MSNNITINCSYKGKKASITLSWKDTPFDCMPIYKGDPEVLGIYSNALDTLSGYFIMRRTSFNIEAHLNALKVASVRFNGFSHTLDRHFDLADHLSDEDKLEDRVY